MRKIEQWMLDKINTQRNADKNELLGDGLTNTCENTMVCTRQRYDGAIVTTVYLHGNLIASFSGEVWEFKMCGWPTTTTRSRINALAHTFGREGVKTKAGKHYSGKTEVNAYDWF